MRIEGQGMAVDYSSARNEAASQSVAPKGDKESGERKFGVEDVKQEAKYTESDLKIATETVNKALRISNYHLEFKLHEDSGRYQVKVVDSDSQKVIREIPPENVLDFSAKVRHMLNEMIGVMVDELV